MDKLKQLYEEYFEMFGDGFPTIPLALNRSEEELIEMVERCLKEGKDAYDIGYLSLEDEVFY